MLFNVILIILILYLIASPFIFLKAIQFGMKIVNNQENAAEVPFFNVPTPKKKPEMTPQQEREAQILANIDRYDGTSNGQVKVRNK